LSRPRGFVVVTGSELVRGDRRDANGPFLAAELLRLGVEPARISIVGDDPAELETAMREGLEADLCCISGGLGPTHDDRSVAMVAHVTGRELVVDEGLEAEIESISRAIAERLDRPYADFAEGVRKQATLPQGAVVVGIAGTAPALVLEHGDGAVVVLPGPPSELQRLWPRALESEPVRKVLSRAREPERRVLRFYGAGESEIARALGESGGEGDGVTATICAREFEIHVDLFVEEEGRSRADELVAGLRERAGRHLFAEDERPVEEIVLDACREPDVGSGIERCLRRRRRGVLQRGEGERAGRTGGRPRAARRSLGRGRCGDGGRRESAARRGRRGLGDRSCRARRRDA
jgi:nicotinamide-nucleotide amidase